ncbi:hypothetical protein HDU88_008422 [Geranomyces variabilis]|nr:hypothetical protein HDU88_008422 [Geranomyces variabilis]
MTAIYRADPLNYQGLARQPPIANLQHAQTGYALDLNKRDEANLPKVVYAWNRQTHLQNDVATQKPPNGTTKLLQRLNAMNQPSKEILRITPPTVKTKAYKDALEFLAAEKAYRQNEAYLDRITPSRGHFSAIMTGSPAAATGPVPDKSGHVYNYPASVTSSTGMVFSAPPNSGTQPKAVFRAGKATRQIPVIFRRDTQINTMPDGSTRMSTGSDVVYRPGVKVNNHEIDMSDIPDLHDRAPGPVHDPNQPPPPVIRASGPPPQLPVKIASSASNPEMVRAILQHNEVYGIRRNFATFGPLSAIRTSSANEILINSSRPHVQGIATNYIPNAVEKGATLLDPTALEIPSSSHLPRVHGAVMTHDLGFAKTAEGMAAQASIPVSLVTGRPRGLKRAMDEDPSEGQHRDKRSKRTPASLPRSAALARRQAAPVDQPPPQIQQVRNLARRRGHPDDPEYGIGTVSTTPYTETVRLRKAQQEAERPRKRQKVAPEEAPALTRPPRTVARARPALVPTVRSEIRAIPPPIVEATTAPLSQVRRLARRRGHPDDPELGIGASLPSEPYVERVRLRKAEVDVSRPAKKQRIRNDLYWTPVEALDPIRKYLTPYRKIWEPASGKLHIVNWLRSEGFQVEASDIIQDAGHDFLATPLRDCEAIVTNPPFSLKCEFMQKCYEHGKPFALLVPLNALETQRMRAILQDKTFSILMPKRNIDYILEGFPPEKKSKAFFYSVWICNFPGLKTIEFLD